MLQNFFSENRAVFEKMCQNIVELDTPQMTIWHMSIACWIPKLQTHTQNTQYLLIF